MRTKRIIPALCAALALLPAFPAAAQYSISQQPYTLTSPATGDLLIAVDVSDTTQSSNGTTKKMTFDVLRSWMLTSVAAGYQPLDSDLTSLAGLTTTSYGRGLLELANAAALRTAAGLVIGTDVQAYNASTTTLGTSISLSSEVDGTLPIANGGTGLTSFGTGVAAALGENVTGTGGAVLASSPVISTPEINGAITFPDNTRQTLNPGADVAGLNVGALSGDPGSPSNGDLWYDSTAHELTARINGANVALGSGGGGGSYQPLDSDLTEIAALATQPYGRGLLTADTEENFHSAVGLAIGVDVQGYDANTTTLGNEIDLESEVTGVLPLSGGGTGGNYDNLSLLGQGLLDAVVTDAGSGPALASGMMLKYDGSNWVSVLLGTDVQAYNASLAAIAAGTWTGASSITTLGTLSNLAVSTGTLTTSTPSTWASTWNSSGVTFSGLTESLTLTAAANGSKFRDWLVGGSSVMSLAYNTTTGNDASPWRLVFGSNASIGYASAWGAVTVRNAANSADANLRCSTLQSTGVSTTNYIAVTGSGTDVEIASNSWRSPAGLRIRSDGALIFSSTTSSTGTEATRLQSNGTNWLQLGADSATPGSQTFSGADGTGSNITGGTMNLGGGRGTGTGEGGPINLQTSAAGSSGSSVNSLRTVLQIKADGSLDSPTMTVESASDPASTHKLTIYVNGVRYKVLAIQE